MDALSILAKRNATCEDLLICMYNLNPMESHTFYQLARIGSSTVDDLSTTLKRDRSTIHRALSKLVSIGLCYKETKTLKDGGYYHVYTSTEPSNIKRELSTKVQDLCRSLEKMVDNFNSDFEKLIQGSNVAHG
ncbi:MAG: hypothetical protein M1368_02635 [Thaumarchaeota archaeon]|nr:hypothetical protein [Nitrososphaerota archaeon]